MRTTFNNKSGTVLVLFAFLLLVLLGFGGLAIDVGSWYVVQAELSKSVDAASLAGARNIADCGLGECLALAQDFGNENFPAGLLGTPTTGQGIVTFTSSKDTNHRIIVTGTVSAPAYLARLFGINQVATTSNGTAKKNEMEIMLVLDRSGSMGPDYGNAIADLKTAATSFVNYFQDTQDTDMMGLVTFAQSVTVAPSLGLNYVNDMITNINAMTAVGGTNAEDALAQAGQPLWPSGLRKGLTDQTGFPGDQRKSQFIIFFTDGVPTAFRGKFTYQTVDYDAVVAGTGQTCDSVYYELARTDSEAVLLNINPSNTGEGGTTCPQMNLQTCTSWTGNTCNSTTYTYTYSTKWAVFDQYPISGYTNPVPCGLPPATVASYICSTARQMTLAQAQALKNRGVMIYTIGLGQVDKTMLSQIASGPSFEYYAASSTDLQAIFNAIAKDISLRLVS